jgi:hypothetical protein
MNKNNEITNNGNKSLNRTLFWCLRKDALQNIRASTYVTDQFYRFNLLYFCSKQSLVPSNSKRKENVCTSRRSQRIHTTHCGFSIAYSAGALDIRVGQPKPVLFVSLSPATRPCSRPYGGKLANKENTLILSILRGRSGVRTSHRMLPRGNELWG